MTTLDEIRQLKENYETKLYEMDQELDEFEQGWGTVVSALYLSRPVLYTKNIA